jgi:hypothetical protein
MDGKIDRWRQQFFVPYLKHAAGEPQVLAYCDERWVSSTPPSFFSPVSFGDSLKIQS